MNNHTKKSYTLLICSMIALCNSTVMSEQASIEDLDNQNYSFNTTKAPNIVFTLHNTLVNIPQNLRIELITLLNCTLAGAIDLSGQLKQAEWNIKGTDFISLHKLFNEVEHELNVHIELLAQRITSLGGTAFATVESAAQNSPLNQYPLTLFTATDILNALAQNFAILSTQTRNAIQQSLTLGDSVTSNIYINVTRFLERYLWIIEAHTQ